MNMMPATLHDHGWSRRGHSRTPSSGTCVGVGTRVLPVAGPGRALANLRMRFPGDPPNAAQRGSCGILGLCSLRVCMHTAPSSYTRVRVWEPYVKFSRVLGSDTELAVLIRLATCLCLGRHYGIFLISCFISYGSRDALSVWLAVHHDKSLS